MEEGKSDAVDTAYYEQETQEGDGYWLDCHGVWHRNSSSPASEPDAQDDGKGEAWDEGVPEDECEYPDEDWDEDPVAEPNLDEDWREDVPLEDWQEHDGPEAEDWETANDGEVAWEDAQLVETTHDGQPEDPQSEWIDWPMAKVANVTSEYPNTVVPTNVPETTPEPAEKNMFSTIEEPCLYLTYKLYRTYCKLVKLRCTHTNNVFKNDSVVVEC